MPRSPVVWFANLCAAMRCCAALLCGVALAAVLALWLLGVIP
jgi:hypothetical protein